MHNITHSRTELILEARKLHDRVTARGGVFTADDLAKLDQLDAATIQLERMAENEHRESIARRAEAISAEESETRAFRRYLRGGLGTLTENERRDLQADVAGSGGNIVAPVKITAAVLRRLNEACWVRQLASVLSPVPAVSIGVATVTTEPADPDWTSEVQAVAADTSTQFGNRALSPNMLTKLIKVAIKLLAAGGPAAEEIIIQRLAAKFSIAQEKAFLTGTGTGQPLGLFTASASGISTGRDVSTGNTSTAFTADGIEAAVAAVKGQYRQNAGWILHRDAVKAARILKDSSGHYMYQPRTDAGKPDLLAGYPIRESEFAPNTFTTGQYVGIFGDLQWYQIVDSMELKIQRLVELYAATNQIGFIGRICTDGAPVDELAFARVKLA